MSRQPNIIWFFGDQHRAQAMGCAGNMQVATPHIDSLARDGVYFSRAVSGCPWCTPFRGSLLSGRYPQHCVDRTPQIMDPALPTVAQTFAHSGYETAYFGKWHLGWSRGQPVPEIDGERRHDAIPVPPTLRGGFGAWIGYNSGPPGFGRYVHGHNADGSERPLQQLPGYESDAVTGLLVDFISDRGDAETPFFAVCSLTPPHSPYVAPDEWLAQYQADDIALRPNVPQIDSMQREAREGLAAYYAMIANLDWNLGRVLAELARCDQLDNTYVCFFSDHGDQHWSHGYVGKSQPWEESIRIPFVIGGGAVPVAARGQVTEALLSAVDMLPTTLGLAGVSATFDLPGFDYSPYLRESIDGPLAAEPDSALLQHFVADMHNENMNTAWRGVVTRDGWKYICIDNAPLAMFDLNSDPFEQHNLVFKKRYRDQRQRLHRRLARWLAETGDSFVLFHDSNA